MAQTRLREKRREELVVLAEALNMEIETLYENVGVLEVEIEYVNKPGFYIPIEGFPSTNIKVAKAKKKITSKKSNAGNEKNKPVVKTSKSGKKKK